MNLRSDLERLVTDWLHADATSAGSDRVLGGALDRVARTGQDRTPLYLRFADMNVYTKFAIAAAAVLVVAVGGIYLLQQDRGGVAAPAATPVPSATLSPGATPMASATSSEAAGSVPGEFTACVPSNRLLRSGTDEQVVVSHPDGDMTVERRRGFTWAGTITATDERFSGTDYYSWDGDGYTLASGEPGPQVVAEGHRIENDAGAWRGWGMGAGLSEATRVYSPYFLTGEGAYEGLTAVLFPTDGGCFFNFTGLVIEVPEPPVPATSQ